jgi:hypothetical protein
MNKIEIAGGSRCPTDDEIIQFQNEFGVILPDNYISFVKKHNGGFIGFDEERDFLDSFNSIKYGDVTVENAIAAYSKYESLCNKDFLPIANSYTGNPITLCLREGELYGKIILFYFDRGEEPELVANSLEELLGIENIEDL